MIHMPRRSVTRFFIPLIDVLLLLFCIFLLMPMSNDKEQQEQQNEVVMRGEAISVLQRELINRSEELDQIKEAQPKADELVRLRAEVEQLRKANQQSLQQRAYFQIIDIDPKTGDISYQDPEAALAKGRPIASDDDAKRLIKEHQEAAGNQREVYYYFLFPRPKGGFPSRGQVARYNKWFGGVANSLRENKS